MSARLRGFEIANSVLPAFPISLRRVKKHIGDACTGRLAKFVRLATLGTSQTNRYFRHSSQDALLNTKVAICPTHIAGSTRYGLTNYGFNTFPKSMSRRRSLQRCQQLVRILAAGISQLAPGRQAPPLVGHWPSAWMTALTKIIRSGLRGRADGSNPSDT